ncbi:MAG: methyltransferase regulatory domain-containing protein [Opitutaceae bacterium]
MPKKPAATPYDRVAYPSMAHPQTFHESLAVKGHLRGLAVAPPDRARVLELGCGDGFNLAAMATVYPRSAFTGIDYAAGAVARGRAMLAEVGLRQVRLEAADIRDLTALEPLGDFDYIIAHGVYSWVPADVRDALLAAIGRRLAPNGVAFVSYLALPGAYRRETVRTMIRFHTQAIADPAEKVRQSRSLLDLIAKGATVENHYTRWIKDELELIAAHSAEGLFHDELAEESAPLLFTDFLNHASRHGLEFLSEAEYVTPIGQALSEAARESLRPLETNRLLLEQYLDFIEGRRFRQTLLCRKGNAGALDVSRLDSLRVSCRASRVTKPAASPAEDADEYEGSGRSHLRAKDPMERTAISLLIERPGDAIPYPQALAAIRSRLEAAGHPVGTDFGKAVGDYLCRAYLPGLVEIRMGEPPFTLEVPAKPLAHPLARFLIRQGAPSVLCYSGRFVEVNGALGRHLVTLLDGTRDAAALVAAVRVFLSGEHAAVSDRGEASALPASDDPSIPEQLGRSLAGLAQLGLFARS